MTVIDTIKDKLHPHHDKHATAATAATAAEPAATETSKNAPDASNASNASNAPTVKFSDTPVFDANKITVIFVLGGPGAGTSLFAVRRGKQEEKKEGGEKAENEVFYRQGYTM